MHPTPEKGGGRGRGPAIYRLTHPALGAIPLISPDLSRTLLPRLGVMFIRVQDVVLIETLEEDVAALVASCPRTSVGGDVAAVTGFGAHGLDRGWWRAGQPFEAVDHDGMDTGACGVGKGDGVVFSCVGTRTERSGGDSPKWIARCKFTETRSG